MGNLVSERTSGGTYYYVFNGLGSIVGLTKNSGDLAGNERYQYDAYGNLLSAPANGLLQANPWRFAGGSFDSATGFTKFGVRYYDATTGRWTQQDPKAGSLFDARSSNRYVYAKCDPVNVTDPGGKNAVTCISGIISHFVWVDVFGVDGALWFITGPLTNALIGLVFAGMLSMFGAIAIMAVVGLLLAIGIVADMVSAVASNCM